MISIALIWAAAQMNNPSVLVWLLITWVPDIAIVAIIGAFRENKSEIKSSETKEAEKA